jgi:hypothetical protein
MEKVPVVAKENLSEATPLVTGAVPSDVPFERNDTLPVGLIPVTVAVTVIC